VKAVKTPMLLLMLAAGAVTAAAIGGGPPRGHRDIEPQADRLLLEMTNYLTSLQSFTVQSSAIDEVVLPSGQKLQLASESLVSVQRPNRLRSEQIGTASDTLAFFYDGRNMTLACKADNSFATVPAPKNIDATIDKVRREFQIDAPGADLLHSRPYEVLTEQVTSGRYIGRETVDDVAAHHLAFEGEQVDWQIWIQEGSQPLPVRFVVTTKGMRSQPQFTVRLSHWQPGAKISPIMFQFADLSGARRVQSFPVRCRPGAPPHG
jgi:hypothetical protein